MKSPAAKKSTKDLNNGANSASPAPAAHGISQKRQQDSHQHEYEFFGPHGPALLILVLPTVVYGLYATCNAGGCLQLYPSLVLPGFPAGAPLISWQAVAVVASWFLGLVLLHLVLPGQRVQGVLLPNGQRLTYKLNAFTLLVLLYGSCLYLAFFTPYLNLGWIVDHCLELITACVLFSTTLAVYLYASSFKKGVLLCTHGTSGWPWYDFWMGRELNPRLGMFDWKEFCELYPGMIGWAIVNLALAHKQWTTLGRVTNSMVLVNAFQLYYVTDALWNESSILTTMDITTDGFGFMLAFGDLAWVPFVFTTSGRFLNDYPQDLSLAGVAAVLAVKFLGYWIFRGANGQKDIFRRNPMDPRVRHLESMPTERGTRLLISGWWGASRHINYFGDWIMGISWCMPCGLVGLQSVVPYFYCIYFATLLIHRERRDDLACRHKYGKDWDKYCSIVKSRIIPGVY
eukprot:CAMPEP_0119109460 /NCGR_PEP_ID=MMETSP1180-20130426/17922_1 /TAXON_ID=3052 ORGANISM="Chlamydomonas cf sp, Strain CCMP681" /NCGR_SAMPLE_ID=MMETSP1180 /ASSEMBLY_ACC=CAM_ASM_000741 /LENGTH=456 /DNA_ID=CAMNT_0007095217 /DNA_START=166 /DNA_END=1536 /DNA_ORIENTATION=+